MNTETRLAKLQEYIDRYMENNGSKNLLLCADNMQLTQNIPKPLIPKTTVALKIQAIQKYIEQLEYCHLGEPFFLIKKHYSVYRLSQLAKEMISCGLPIKCLEATVLGIYLTMGLDMDRIPLAFKSTCEGNTYRHIVLIIKHKDKYGAVGLSRRSDLMDKPLSFKVFLNH
jgi:hypothetical protein